MKLLLLTCLTICFLPAGAGEGSKVGVGTLVLTHRPESDLSNASPDPPDRT